MENDTFIKVLTLIALAFIGPALFIWIWNTHFSNWYVFTYWEAFWLAVALKFLGV